MSHKNPIYKRPIFKTHTCNMTIYYTFIIQCYDYQEELELKAILILTVLILLTGVCSNQIFKSNKTTKYLFLSK